MPPSRMRIKYLVSPPQRLFMNNTLTWSSLVVITIGLSTCGQSWDRRSLCTRRRSKGDDNDDDENEVSTVLVTCVRKLKALWILCRLHRVVHIMAPGSPRSQHVCFAFFFLSFSRIFSSGSLHFSGIRGRISSCLRAI